MQAPRTLFITGAARRLGAQMCLYFHDRGWNVAFTQRKAGKEADELWALLNSRRADSAEFLELDYALDEAHIQNVAEQAVARWGRVDVLVNNASAFGRRSLSDIDMGHAQSMLQSNYLGPLFLTKALVPELAKRQGSVINITDIHAERPLPHFAAYSAAKAALVALTRCLAIELAPAIRVNALAPGSMTWPDEHHFDPEFIERTERAIPLQRVGNGFDLAQAAQMLIDSTYITGQVLPVDGGRSALPMP